MHELLTSGFSLQKAVLMAEFSRLCYHSGEDLSEWAERGGLAEADARLEGQFRLCRVSGEVDGKKALLLGVRGSANARNWILNFRLAPLSYPAGGRVHAGFLAGLAAVLPLMEAEVARFEPDVIRVAGHSLGGAIALLAALALRGRGAGDVELHTFGQPRTGSGSFAAHADDALEGRYFRFVNQGDIVTRIPPGFSHCGTLKHIVRPGVLERFGVEAAPLAPDELNLNGPVLEEAGEPPALTEEEFREFQAGPGAVPPVGEEGRDVIPETGAVSEESLMLEGRIPWVAQHGMDEYVRLLREML